MSEYQDWKSILGHQFEDYTVHLLSKLGFDNVHATQATRDYGIDVLGKINFRHSFGIQCKHVKSHRHKVGYRAVEEAISGAKYYHTQECAVITNGVFTRQAQKGAKRNHVFLWDNTTCELFYRMAHAHLTIYDLMDYEKVILPFVKGLF